MPKKTKKQKILAEYRKKLKQLQSNQNVIPDTSHKVEIVSETPSQKPLVPITTLPKKTATYQESEYDKLLAKFTIQDLKKASFITLFILALEFFIFYVNLKR